LTILELFEESGFFEVLSSIISAALKIQADDVRLRSVINIKDRKSANGVRIVIEMDIAVVAMALGVSTSDEEGLKDTVSAAILGAIPSLVEAMAKYDVFLKLLGYRNAEELRFAGVAFSPDDVSLELRSENQEAFKVLTNAPSFSEPIYIGMGIVATTLLAVLCAWAIRRRCHRRAGVAARTDSNVAIETDVSASSASSPVPYEQGTSVSPTTTTDTGADGSQGTVRAVHAIAKAGTAANSDTAMAPVHERRASTFNRSTRRPMQRRFSADVSPEPLTRTISGSRSYSWAAASFFRASHRIEPLQPATMGVDIVPHVPIGENVSASADASIPVVASPSGSTASGAAPSARRSARNEMAVEVTPPGENQQRSRTFERFVVLSSARSKTSRSASASPRISERAGIPSPAARDPPISPPLLHHRVEEPIAHAGQSPVAPPHLPS
jgi:hypothetical protein